MNKPFISCKCLTYSRIHLIEEALYSFLIQDYPEELSELIIINDYPLQKLIFDHQRVKIYNLNSTFPIIGAKENYGIEKCKGDIIMCFDDDDISLPNHFNNIAKYWKENTNLLMWSKGVYYNEPEITAISGIGNAGYTFSKKAWEAVGKSPLINSGGDREFINKIASLAPEKVVSATPLNHEVSFFYRWATPLSVSGLGCYHSSGQGDDIDGKPNIVQRNSTYIESQRKLGKVPIGNIILKPHHKRDYSQMLKNYINK